MKNVHNYLQKLGQKQLIHLFYNAFQERYYNELKTRKELEKKRKKEKKKNYLYKRLYAGKSRILRTSSRESSLSS